MVGIGKCVCVCDCALCFVWIGGRYLIQIPFDISHQTHRYQVMVALLALEQLVEGH